MKNNGFISNLKNILKNLKTPTISSLIIQTSILFIIIIVISMIFRIVHMVMSYILRFL